MKLSGYFFVVAPIAETLVLVVVHHPFIDVRPFLVADTGHLPNPVWSNVQDDDFIRGCGRLASKHRGGVPAESEPEGEKPSGKKIVDDVYCGFDGALGFRANPLTYKGEKGLFPGLLCAFRRLLVMPEHGIVDSLARRAEIVARAEIGLRVLEPRQASGGDVLSVVHACVRVPMRVPAPKDAEPKQVDLVSAGPSLAAHLLRSTTRSAFLKDHAVEKHWFSAKNPLIIAEMRADEPWSLDEAGGNGGGGGWQRLEIPPEAKIEVLHRTLEIGGKNLPFWLLRLGEGAKKDCARRLRIYLARMHAQREATNKVLHLLQAKRLTFSSPPDPTAVNADLLLRYLERCMADLSKRKAYGFSQVDAQRLAYHYHSVVSDAKRDELLEMLKAVHPTLAGRVGRYTANGGRADGGGAVKVLFVTGKPSSKAAQLAESEYRRLLDTLDFKGHRGAIQPRFSPFPDMQRLQRELRDFDPDVLHFASQDEKGMTVLGPDDVPVLLEPETIREVFGRLGSTAGRRLRVVLLSRCYSAEQSAAMRAHVDFVVGTEAAMDAEPATSFVTGFYDNVGFGENVADAVGMARASVSQEVAITHLDSREGVAAEAVYLVPPFAPDELS